MSETLEKLIEKVLAEKPREETSDGAKYRVHPLRGHIRYHVFLYRNTGIEHIPGLVGHFEKQFRKGWDWDNFSFVWDISPTNPMKAIPEREWLMEGGAAIDSREGELFTAAHYHPNGFTGQAR
jgi:hypothetical protein